MAAPALVPATASPGCVNRPQNAGTRRSIRRRESRRDHVES